MLDIVGSIVATAICAAIVGVLVGFAPISRAAKLLALAAAAAWAGTVVAVGALGGFAPGTTGPLPAVVIPFVLLLALLFGGWFLVPSFRAALLAVPLPALVALNGARLGGVFVLLLAADGRLSSPFAPIAAWGDMIAAAIALLLAARMVRADEHPAWAGLWNGFGALDLIVAVSLGLLSSPGTPFRVFTEGPGTRAMTTLPWTFVPSMIVPLFLLIHLVIAARLRQTQRMPQAMALAG
jgi:hypothetical protein